MGIKQYSKRKVVAARKKYKKTKIGMKMKMKKVKRVFVKKVRS